MIYNLSDKRTNVPLNLSTKIYENEQSVLAARLAARWMEALDGSIRCETIAALLFPIGSPLLLPSSKLNQIVTRPRPAYLCRQQTQRPDLGQNANRINIPCGARMKVTTEPRNLPKGGKQHDLHVCIRRNNGDGDDAAHASGEQQSTENSHELGRGYRQGRRAAAPGAMAPYAIVC